MSEEILINVAPMETRVAVVDNGVLQEVYIERAEKRGLVGNIYKGKVARVMPGMQAAFVDIGLERAAFIHAADIVTLDANGMEHRKLTVPDIRTLVHEGKTLIVQVIKEPIGTKGARLTTHLSVSSRFLVYMPYTNHIGMSQKIENEAERERLLGIVESCLPTDGREHAGGFIVRTVAENALAEEIQTDAVFLQKLWSDLKPELASLSVPSVIYNDLPLFLRTMRDAVKPSVEKVRIDSREEYERLLRFASDYESGTRNVIEHYDGERPIFDLYSVEEEIQKALERRVNLKSGGYLIIDQTEAMTTIDVNTGAFIGHTNQEETLFKTNLEAATTLARQLRLRNLGGIIIVDFIDMQDPEHQRQVVRVLEKAIEKDPAKIAVTGISELGLVQMTRKRTRESLSRTLCESCPVCQGRGILKSAESVCYEIMREILRGARTYDSKQLLVMASQEVIDRLLDEDSASVADIEDLTQKSIRFRVESVYNREQYDIVPM
ncbi:MAG: ribonuclease G [Cellvibrionales bacterium]|jgi:ribonuclease G|nr:ribonuclease G [Cellvibrionales bacterium]HRF87252.1 ribonuclease G [Pseudomonadales bacterium]HRG49709.1 ribonuclease G [Pseudomonadales bacterium]